MLKEVKVKNYQIKDCITWAFYGFFCFMATRMVNSVDKLNVEMAKVVTVVGQHEKRLDKLEQ